MRSPSNGRGIPSMQGRVGSHHGGVRYSRRAPCSDCYHQSLFENQPCATELFTAIQRPNLRDDFRGAGECFPSEAADLPSLSLE